LICCRSRSRRESSGATSYHLRQLAHYGYIEEAPTKAGRERWWRYRQRRAIDTAQDFKNLLGNLQQRLKDQQLDLQVLARNTASSLGWLDNTSYDFSVTYRASGRIDLAIRRTDPLAEAEGR